MNEKVIHIVGAGPASIIASLNLARAGFETIVHEQRSDVGFRFNGDFQGIENWSTEEDALEFLNSIGISVNFMCQPYAEGEFYSPSLQKFTINNSRPLFYLVERGTNEWSLDQGLKRQALEAGVKINWNNKMMRVKSGHVIVGTGPKAADVIAKGIVFKTSLPDRYYGFLNDRIAPKGYAYLLVNKRRATFATCFFDDFKHERVYFERALETMQRVVKIDINQPKEFGGYGNFFLNQPLVKDNRILYVGENAGFQDALWGFGMRYAMLSGYLAAQSIITGKSYEQLCKEKLKSNLETSLANRWLFAHLNNFGYEQFLKRMSRMKDVAAALRTHYKPSWQKRFLFQIVRRWYHSRLIDRQCMHEHCDCVWCKHGKDAHGSMCER